ncbi:structure-specific endonuclease subunit SLX1 homolog [Anastrepha ludens]|uniref:structure-specific endonuclease subunit SLX1 homolog n=1 Tax=Anastrepha ludens TaxID=28586 RepID=UPI0023AFF41B|nr:structure-specific endonuclease subunit SLX1 homolog [Anastrepha ludens]XP_053968767.1 structure-specific endonuclease subunit SLX1 homolog [Anastrepha ludens]
MTSSYFYGVYLLCSLNPDKRFAGRCYIGFTVDPNRRINQHNRGKEFGGAKRTSNKGPWKMVMIVHGFPNNIAALQFEWAWQQPALSTRLKSYPELRRKNRKESHFEYNFRILSRMLNVGPWHRLPLTIRWLESEYECDFMLKPPAHMQIVSGDIILPKSQSARQKRNEELSPPRAIWAHECHLCMQPIENPERSRIGCINSLCKLTCHIICLANYILSSDESNRGHYIPISGECPLCEEKFAWIDLLRRKCKLQANGVEQIEEEDDDDEYDIDSDDYNGYKSDLSTEDAKSESENGSMIGINSKNDIDIENGHVPVRSEVPKEDDILDVCKNDDIIYVLSD